MIDPRKVINAFRSQAGILASHHKALDILEGNLEPYLLESLSRQLSPRVFQYAKDRLVPINIMPRYIDKISTIYQTGVTREVVGGNQSDEDLLAWYEDQLNINDVMMVANKLYNACNSTLIHPYIGNEGPALRVIANDKFVVVSDDPIERTKPTMVILIAGVDDQGHQIFWVYTDLEFAVIKSNETYDLQAMADMGIPDGINPYGRLPFVYINSSSLRLVPVPDTDTIKMTEYIPIALTDLNLAAMFSAFSITHITNGSVENLVYAPNALWFLKADDPEKDVQIGTLKPQVDYQEVLNLIQSELSLWMGTKGIKSSSVGQITVDNASSGIAKIIDESDTFDVRQAQTIKFSCAEKYLWSLILEVMHPVSVFQGEVQNRALFSAEADVLTNFAVTPVGSQRAQLIADQRDEYAAGFTTRARAIAALNPQMSNADVDELITTIDQERNQKAADNVNQTSESQNTVTGANSGQPAEAGYSGPGN